MSRILLLVLRVVLLIYAAFATVFSSMFDNNVTAWLYLAALVLALVGLFKLRASLVALACIGLAELMSWGAGNPGHRDSATSMH